MTEKQKISVVRVYGGEPMLPDAVLVGDDEHGRPIMMDSERVQTLNVLSTSTAKRPVDAGV